MTDLYSQFSQPSAAYRGKPFWSWNGELQKQELLRQVHIMQQMGMGGFFMHSRSGLITEYLGDEWFELINACADEAEKIGLEAWLYDEDRWPSGTAGGLVTENPLYRAKFMRLSTLEASAFQWTEDIVAAFACHLEGQSFDSCHRLSINTPPEDFTGRTILIFTVEEMAKQSFYNGFTYLDTLKREATDEFLAITHQAYLEKCGDRLGRSIQGIFIDEPHRGAVMNGFGLDNADKGYLTPWTENLPTQFEAKFGYDLLERLPDLFLQRDSQAIAPTKWHYMDLVQEMFLENFARPIYEWCDAQKLRLTGHALHEVSLTAQVAMQGSLMRFYELMHDPGIDILSGCNHKYWAVKQLSSVARQIGQKWLLSELYGCTGWERTFADHKEIGNWQALFGINVRCHHLSWYTMEGDAKRDYPASIFYQSAWWQEYHHVETYFSRLHVLLSQGTPVCDILVVSPIESVSAQIHAGWANGLSPQDASVHRLEEGYSDLFFMLAGGQLDFDYGDEEMMSRLSSVERDENGAAVLRVGKAIYRVVVLGHMATIRSSTLRLLNEFIAAGGQVIQMGEAADFVDAAPSQQAHDLAMRAIQLPWDASKLLATCKPMLMQRVEIVDANSGLPLENIFCQLRQDGDRKILVAMNVDPVQSYRGAIIRVVDQENSGTWHCTEWDCFTGERFGVATTQNEGVLEFSLDFEASGEHAFLIEAMPAQVFAPNPDYKEVSCLELEGPFPYKLSEPNVCVLDLARHQLDGAEWQSAMEILQVDRAIRSHYGCPFRSGQMIQPWYREKFHPTASETLGQLKLAFEFFIEEMPAQALHLAMERPEFFEVSINGRRLQTQPNGWWVDTAFQKLAIPSAYLQTGSNVVVLETAFYQGLNLEAIYLLGEFGVELNGSQKTLVKLPATIEVGDLTQQGLPFYGGALTLDVPIPEEFLGNKKAILKVDHFEAACLKVQAEGETQLIAWAPHQLEVTNSIREGHLSVEIILTRRNTFGPLHLIPVRAGGYGPASFVTQGDSFSEHYGLISSGLLAPPVISFGA